MPQFPTWAPLLGGCTRATTTTGPLRAMCGLIDTHVSDRTARLVCCGAGLLGRVVKAGLESREVRTGLEREREDELSPPPRVWSPGGWFGQGAAQDLHAGGDSRALCRCRPSVAPVWGTSVQAASRHPPAGAGQLQQRSRAARREQSAFPEHTAARRYGGEVLTNVYLIC